MHNIDIACSGARFLAGLAGADGRFKYRYDARTGHESKGYNVLRHAGSIWSMLDVYSFRREEKVLASARRAVTYLLNNYLQFFRDYNNVCICEDNKIKLGGNALTIIALISLSKITHDPFLINISERLGHFMIDEQGPDGDLIHKRYFRSGKISDFKSMYYTGEALLALMELYNATRDSKWLDAVKSIEAKLAAKNYGVKEQSHWMLYALAALSEVDNSTIYYDHAAKIAKHILEHPDYLTWDRSTPTACRTEGLIAFLGMTCPRGESDEELKGKCLQQVTENLSLQKTFIHSEGDFVRGGDDHRKDEVRIDYIQHNISSFLHFAQLNQP